MKLSHGAKLTHFRSFGEFWGTRFVLDCPEIALLERFCRREGVLFDVGANIGAYSTLLSAMCPEATIFAFEPSPDTAALLRLNLQSSQVSNVKVEIMALADVAGSSEFVNRSSSPETNRLVREPESGLTIRVATTTLDSYTATNNIDRIDFIKIDVEGAEPLVLRGARRLMQERRIGAGMIEICPRNLTRFGFSLSDLFAAANNNGYRVHKLLPDGAAGVPCYASEFGEDALCNAVLMPA
ncbi:MAG: FkbM family methyltransferase [Bryobacteraceae bacterium]